MARAVRVEQARRCGMGCCKDPNTLEKGRSVLIKSLKKKNKQKRRKGRKKKKGKKKRER